MVEGPPASRTRKAARREAEIIGHKTSVVYPPASVKSGSGVLTRAAVAGGRRWLAVDSGYSPDVNVQFPSHVRGALWDSKHQIYYLPSAQPGPSFAVAAPRVGDPLTLFTSVDGGELRASVGVSHGYCESPYLAVTGGLRTKSIVGLYDCSSRSGDCGSLVMSDSGAVGLHCGTLLVDGRRLNAYYPFDLHGLPQSPVREGSHAVRQSGRRVDARLVSRAPARPSPSTDSAAWRESRKASRAIAAAPSTALALRDASASRSQRQLGPIMRSLPLAGVSSREAGIVGMSPAPSDLPSRSTRAVEPAVEKYIEMLMNPWSGAPVRLPDHVVVPTSLARFVANRTYTFANCATNGGNFLFGLSNRLNNTGVSPSFADRPADALSAFGNGTAGGTTPYTAMTPYSYSPGCILSPLQWGLGAHANPRSSMVIVQPNPAVVNGPWGDDYGSTLSQTLSFVSAYRVLSMAIRTRIVGLPASQFMAPGKIYYAQIRCDNSDLPVTEQDFVAMEQLGRATHVSADAVRAAGSKTVFYTPDGPSKFNMTSNFLPPPGVFRDQDVQPSGGSFSLGTGGGVRFFPGATVPMQVPQPSIATPLLLPSDWSRNILPYSTEATQPSSSGVGDAADSANADATSFLVVGYFGAQDGLTLEVDYASVAEYIPQKNAPGGIEALVQLPSSRAMDDIFAAAAVLTEAKPVMLQQPGDLTIAHGSTSSREAGRPAVAAPLSRYASRVSGSAYREGFWDFNWLKKGSLGDNNIRWNFK